MMYKFFLEVKRTTHMFDYRLSIDDLRNKPIKHKLQWYSNQFRTSMVMEGIVIDNLHHCFCNQSLQWWEGTMKGARGFHAFCFS